MESLKGCEGRADFGRPRWGQSAQKRVRRGTGHEPTPLFPSSSSWPDAFGWPVLRSSKGTLLQASEGSEVLGKTTRPKSPVKNYFLIIFSLKIIDLFIFLIHLSVINKLSYYGRIRNLKFRWTISKIFVFLKGQLLDHTIKSPNEGMSGFTLMFKFLDLTKCRQSWQLYSVA